MEHILYDSRRYNDFTRFLLNYFNDGKRNIVFSPYAILSQLAILGNALSGPVQDEIFDFLRGDRPKDQVIRGFARVRTDPAFSGGLGLANAIQIPRKYAETIDPAFRRDLGKAFGGRIFSSHDGLSEMNRWTREKTFGKTGRLSFAQVRGSDAVFQSAAAINGIWPQHYTQKRNTRRFGFLNPEGFVQDGRCLRTIEVQYLNNGQYYGFVKPYAEIGCSLMGLVPQEFRHLSDILSGPDLTRAYVLREKQRHVVCIPMVEFTFETDLAPALKEFGFRELFSGRTDLSALSTAPLQTFSLYHKAHIKIGTQSVYEDPLPEEQLALFEKEPDLVYPRRFNFGISRPCVFAVINNVNGLPLLAGLVNHL